MSILVEENWDNLCPLLSDLEPSISEPIESALAVIVHIPPSLPTYKPLPNSRNLEIIDPKEYRISPDIIKQIVWMPQKYDTTDIGERDCTVSFSPENGRDHALLAMHHGYVAGVLFGAIENWANGRRVFDVRILCVRKQWRKGGGQEELAKEQVGTKLMLAAMKKAQDLGLDIVTLYYFAPCDGNENYTMACRKREGLFMKLSREIPSDSSLEEHFDMSDRLERERHMTYYLRTPDYTFDFERETRKLIRDS